MMNIFVVPFSSAVGVLLALLVGILTFVYSVYSCSLSKPSDLSVEAVLSAIGGGISALGLGIPIYQYGLFKFGNEVIENTKSFYFKMRGSKVLYIRNLL